MFLFLSLAFFYQEGYPLLSQPISPHDLLPGFLCSPHWETPWTWDNLNGDVTCLFWNLARFYYFHIKFERVWEIKINLYAFLLHTHSPSHTCDLRFPAALLYTCWGTYSLLIGTLLLTCSPAYKILHLLPSFANDMMCSLG